MKVLRLLLGGEVGRYRFQFRTVKPVTKRQGIAVVDGVGHSGVLGELRRHFALSAIMHQNFEPDYYADAFHGHWRRGMMVRAGYRAERRCARDADLNLFVTREDLARFAKEFVDARGPCVVIGVQETRVEFVPVDRRPCGPLRVLITGNLGDRKGVVGLLDMLAAVGARVREFSGVVQFVIVGRRAPAAIRSHADGHLVCLIENAPDIQSIARTCDVYCNPNFTGSGIKVRNLDGLRNGLPVFCRVENAAGFTALPVEVFRTFRSTSEGLSMLTSTTLREQIRGDGVRRHVWQIYADHFTVEAGARAFREALGDALALA